MSLALAFAGVATALGPPAVAQKTCQDSAIVQWTDPGSNGHYYQAVCETLTWEDARTRAEARGGYLATPLSAAENDFVFGLVDDDLFWDVDPDTGNSIGPWLGASQSQPCASEPSGCWAWITGEDFSFTAWAAGEPNDFEGREDSMGYFAQGVSRSSAWNDFPNDKSTKPFGFVIEWESDPTVDCVEAPSGMVSWWRGEGSALDSADANDGTPENGLDYGVGRVGSAFLSTPNGTGSFSVGSPANLQLQNFSVETWVKVGSTAFVSHPGHGIAGWGQEGWAFVIGGATSGAGGYNANPGEPYLTWVGHNTVAATGMSIKDTEWHHVAMTKNGGEVRFYLDSTEFVVPQAYEPPFTFGSTFGAGPPGGLANSRLDELSVYDRALSAAEIASIHGAGLAGKCDAEKPDVCVTNPTAICATNDSETVEGTDSDDVILSFGGADLVLAGFGADLVKGGGGNDTIYGDTKSGGARRSLQDPASNDDTLLGGGGADLMYGEGGDDKLKGGGGADTLQGSGGFDLLIGGPGRDTCIVSRGDRTRGCERERRHI